MASTNALFTGLTGLNANARGIDVVGNNIANVNTTAFKSSRALFATMLPRTINLGTPPAEVSGGTNPFQIGNGVKVAGTQRNMAAAASSATGNASDLAIDGNGFFIVEKSGEQMYTRSGAFQTDATNSLTTIDGGKVRGFGVDSSFQIVSGTLTDLTIPLGELKVADATSLVRFSGNLNAQGPLPTQGSRINLLGTSSGGFTTMPGVAPPPPDVLLPGTPLIDIRNPQIAGTPTPLFSAGQTLQLREAQKGAVTIPSAVLNITATSTVQDFMMFLGNALGLSSAAGPNPDGNIPGVALDTTTGIITATGNTGSANDLSIEASDLRLLDSSGTVVGYPFIPSKTAAANGESVRTGLIVYDSLGAEVALSMTMVLDARSGTGTTWRYFAESPDTRGGVTTVATGTIAFDTDGQPVSSALIPISLDRTGTGAASPLVINIDFAGTDNGLTALADDNSELSATFRDGAPLGTLTSYGVGRDGIIQGAFTNGQTRTLGQIALATFSNPEGLVEAGNSLFSSGANSGNPTITTPGDFGTGQITAGALELSNVDLGEEFIKMIGYSTGYSASSRVIRTADELLQQLMVIGR